MYRLEGYRIIRGESLWVNYGEFVTIEALLAAIGKLYALDYRMVVVASGAIFPVEFVEDKADTDYCVPTISQENRDKISGQKSIPLDANRLF